MDIPVILWILIFSLMGMMAAALITNEADAARWIAQILKLQERAHTKAVNTSWIYNTNLTDYNLKRRVSKMVEKIS